MNIDVENIDQCKNFFFNESIFYPMYAKLEDISSSHPNIYLISPFLAVTDGFFNLVESVCEISEAIFKGFINIGGSHFNTKCNSYRGVLQWGGAVAMGALTPLIITLRMMKITQQFFKNPIWFSSDQAQKYRPLQSILN